MNAENLRNIFSAKGKLEALSEYSRKNHTKKEVNLWNDDFKTISGLNPLGNTELKSVVDQINRDPNAPQNLRDMVAGGKITGPSVNNTIKYLDSLAKK